MLNKITGIVTFLIAAISSSVYAHNNFNGTLGTSTTARDVILFKCSTQAGITVASVSAQDRSVINSASQKIKVQIAKATSSSTCPAYTSPSAPSDLASPWTAGKVTGTDGGTWSTRTYISVSQTSPNNYYCIAVTKDVASSAQEDYSLNHHCEIFAGDNTHQASTSSPAPLGYIQNQ